MNGDGRPDLVVMSFRATEPGVYLLTNEGESFTRQELRQPYQFGDVALGDFDGDGRPDIVIGDAWQGTVTILYNRDDGFKTGPTYPLDPVFTAGALPEYDIRVADFNGDSRPDILVTSSRAKVYLILSAPSD